VWPGNDGDKAGGEQNPHGPNLNAVESIQGLLHQHEGGSPYKNKANEDEPGELFF
jgi:hypothetical protein